MKIALATSTVSVETGANTGLNMLARQLQERGHEVSRWRMGRMPNGEVHAIRRWHDVMEQREGYLIPGKDDRLWPTLWDDHDVVHITNYGVMSLGFGEVLDKSVGALVFSLHDPHEVENYGRSIIGLMRRADRVMFIGRTFMEHVKGAGYFNADDAERKCRWTPQPYCRVAAPGMPMHRASLKKARRVICTSPWRWNKRIPVIARAASHLPDDVTTEFWTGNKLLDVEVQLEEVPAYFSRCRVMDGWKWPEQAPEVYGTASVLVDLVAFSDEDVGRTEYPILEAWDWGVSPIVNKNHALGEHVTVVDQLKPGRNVYVTPAEPLAVATAICVALEKPVMRAEMDESLEPHLTAGDGFVAAYEEAVEERRNG